ncbi:hypothetical protein [Mucilaginibacter sp.]|uniref:hypothetical protein n=1 Tax=Mucilaginibacter sp. TaxID=1882438 RepID=UPI00260435E3|nr:hypothetical protein [Mucilaginibacter sp.]MDB5129818.1 hypothetical protein [Mucilaginibacter sp.]
MEEFPVLKYTAQLYFHPFKDNIPMDERDDAPIQIASGVFIKGTSKYFLLTCKHVFDNIKAEDVIILTSLGFALRLPDNIKFINNDTDSIDLAMVEFKNERLEHLKAHYSFLPLKYLGFNHIFDDDLFYMLFGFINKRTDLKDHAFYVESFGYLTNTRTYKKIKELGFNYTENVTLEYNIRKQGDFNDDTRRLGPKDLKGLSGGGIWLSVAGKRANTYKYILVGIMIEERLDRGFVIGTKIELIKNVIIPD